MVHVEQASGSRTAGPRPLPPVEQLLTFRSKLPAAEAILPYLRQIDLHRVYSNYGPLVMLLQRRLADLFGTPDRVVTTASGVAALIAGILASGGRARPGKPYAICPAHTFIGTATAAQQCGYEPYLVDVSPDTWMIDPGALIGHPVLDRVGVVIPVAAFGRAVDVAAWSLFQERTGIPVVIDAAAAIEAMADGKMRQQGGVSIALSFHATKAFGCGEGGCVVMPDRERAALAAQSLNFGLLGAHHHTTAGTNGKMSEYHAAVALAELDGWDAKRSAFACAVERYTAEFDRHHLPPDDLIAAPDIASNYLLYRCADPSERDGLAAALASGGIESRQWYGSGLHGHGHLRACPRDRLTVTAALSGRLLGLPMACDIPADAVRRVARVLVDQRLAPRRHGACA